MKKNLNAIFSEDLEKLLNKFNEYSEIESGNRFCCICGSLITLSNIQLLIPHNNKPLEYVCNSTNCVERYHTNKP